nr:class I SAM-dependent methyltransferase [Dehalococcoidia bacterium]
MIHFIDEVGSAPWADLCEAYYLGERSDVSFYLDQSSQVGGSLLELGCSTGRITELLADFGKSVYAVDPSTSQLNFARAKIDLLANREQVTFTRSSLVDLNISNSQKFSLAVVPCFAFMSLIDAEQQQHFINTVRRQLSPGGRLIVDLAVPDLEFMLGDPSTMYHHKDLFTDDGNKIVIYTQVDYEEYSQIGYVKVAADFLDNSGLVTRRVVHDLEFRYTFRWEMY